MACSIQNCGKPNQIYTYCADHFIDQWWRSAALKDNKPVPGMPEMDLRGIAGGEWQFSVCVIMSDPDYIANSRKFVMQKLTKGKLFKNAKRPSTGMGHSYIRFKCQNLTGATRDHITFGLMSNGVVSPDGEAGKKPLDSELAIDYTISDQQKDAVCEEIGRWLAGHLIGNARYHYDIMSSNCTQFAKDCSEAAGVYFAGSRIPAYSNTSGWNKTYTPGKLYDAMSKSRFGYDPRRDHSPGSCPGGFMGLQVTKGVQRKNPGSYEFRKTIEKFKADFGVQQEDIAIKLMAMVSEGRVKSEHMAELLKEHKPKDVLQSLTHFV